MAQRVGDASPGHDVAWHGLARQDRLLAISPSLHPGNKRDLWVFFKGAIQDGTTIPAA
jgi:hypothetical protein